MWGSVQLSSVRAAIQSGRSSVESGATGVASTGYAAEPSRFKQTAESARPRSTTRAKMAGAVPSCASRSRSAARCSQYDSMRSRTSFNCPR